MKYYKISEKELSNLIRQARVSDTQTSDDYCLKSFLKDKTPIPTDKNSKKAMPYWEKHSWLKPREIVLKILRKILREKKVKYSEYDLVQKVCQEMGTKVLVEVDTPDKNSIDIIVKEVLNFYGTWVTETNKGREQELLKQFATNLYAKLSNLSKSSGKIVAEIDQTFEDIETYRKMRKFSEKKSDMAIWLNLETVEFLRSIIQPKLDDKDTPIEELADVLILAFDACNLYGIGNWKDVKKIIDAKMKKNYKKKY